MATAHSIEAENGKDNYELESVAALECFERWGQAGPDTSQVGPMWSGSGKYILVWGRGEARGGFGG